MPIDDRAILEIVVEQLEAHGVTDIIFCVGYLSHLIRTVFDNRANGHVNINYVQEQELLGTVESAPTKHTYPAKPKQAQRGDLRPGRSNIDPARGPSTPKNVERLALWREQTFRTSLAQRPVRPQQADRIGTRVSKRCESYRDQQSFLGPRWCW